MPAGRASTPLASRMMRRLRAAFDGAAGCIVIASELMVWSRVSGMARRGHGGEQFAHPLDLDALVGVHVGGVAERIGLLGGAGARKERLHHRECALVVLDHELQE